MVAAEALQAPLQPIEVLACGELVPADRRIDGRTDTRVLSDRYLLTQQVEGQRRVARVLRR